MNKESQKGLSMIESLMTMTILVIGILAVGGMQTTAVKSNAIASDITEASVLAAGQIELLAALPYNDPLLNDTHGDGTTGLNKIGANADHQRTQSKYTNSWNVATNSPMNNTKSVRVIVTWTGNGKSRQVSIDYIKADN